MHKPFGLSLDPVSDQRLALVAMVDSPALVARFDDVAMVRQSVQQRGCHFGIGEHARPFAEGKVGCQQEKNRFDFRHDHSDTSRLHGCSSGNAADMIKQYDEAA